MLRRARQLTMTLAMFVPLQTTLPCSVQSTSATLRGHSASLDFATLDFLKQCQTKSFSGKFFVVISTCLRALLASNYKMLSYSTTGYLALLMILLALKVKKFRTFVGAAPPLIATFRICSMSFRAQCVDSVNYQAVDTVLVQLRSSNAKDKSFRTWLGAAPC